MKKTTWTIWGAALLCANVWAGSLKCADWEAYVRAVGSIPPVFKTVGVENYSSNRLSFVLMNALEMTRGGRIWLNWISGGDGADSFTVGAWSDDGGKTFTDVNFVIDSHDGTVTDRTNIIGCYWMDPNGWLHCFTDQSVFHYDRRAGVWEMVCKNPDSEKPVWSKWRRIANGHLINKPIILSNGDWAFAAYLQNGGAYGRGCPKISEGRLPFTELDGERSATCYVSSDGGSTWKKRGTAPFPGTSWPEAQLLETKDGTLRMYARVRASKGDIGFMASESKDGGWTWTTPQAVPGMNNTASRFQIMRLKSGRVLFISHGKPDENCGRRRLSAWISDDEGATWKGGLMLDRGNGSYPDAFQAPDGSIYVAHDHGRGKEGEIWLHRFTEEDVLAGKIVSSAGFLRRVVFRAMQTPFNRQRYMESDAARVPTAVFPGDARHSTTNRAYTGISSIAVAKNGRMWATWYTGTTYNEDRHNYSVLSTSMDGGKTWKEVYVADPDWTGARRTFDPEVWIAPDGKLRWTWTDRVGSVFSDPANDQLWMLELDAENEPTDPRPIPRYVASGVMMCKPTVLSNGEWLLPVARWKNGVSAQVVVSSDGGRTYSVRGGASLPEEQRLFDEHIIVEKKNGDLWMLIRGAKGFWESFSKDRGRTWSPCAPSRIKHTSSRLFFTRLSSGALLLVKHGRPDQDVGRRNMTAYLSDDDGETWTGGLPLDPRGASYPDGQQCADGTIVVTYDYDRRGEREVLFCAFTEADVRAKRDTGTFKMRQLISKSAGLPPQPKRDDKKRNNKK